MKRAQAPVQADRAPQPGRIRAVFLAVTVHAAFFALIVFGVRWQSSPTVPLQAELWSKLPPAVAKAPPPPEPPKPEPEPPKPEPPKPEPPKPPEEAKPEPAKPDPAIALKLEREKREKERREKLEKEREKKKKEEEKKKREDEKRRKEEEIAKREAEKAGEAAAVARATEVDAWKRRIHDKIRARANVPDTVTGNPEVIVLIHILPGGEVLDFQITKRSGNPAYDAAIERAIRSASPLPVPPPNSELFPSFRDLTLKIRHER